MVLHQTRGSDGKVGDDGTPSAVELPPPGCCRLAFLANRASCRPAAEKANLSPIEVGGIA